LDEIATNGIATIYNNSQTENTTTQKTQTNNTIALDEIATKEIATIYNDSQTENTTRENHIETTQKLGKKNNKNEKVF
jgi:hypothetical protein